MGSAVGYSKLWLFHIAFLLVISLHGRTLARNGRSLISSPVSGDLIKIFFLFFAWYFLSGLWAPNALYWMRYIAYLVFGGGLMIAIAVHVNSEGAYLRLMSVIKSVTFLALVIGLLEAFTALRLPTSPYSEYAEMFGREGLALSSLSAESAAFLKSSPTSFWGNPNNFALAMVMTSPYFMLRARSLLGSLGLVAVFAVVVMTGSRGAAVAFLLGIGLCLLWIKYDHALALFFAALLVVIAAPLVKDSVYASSPRLAQISLLAADAERYISPPADGVGATGGGDSIDVRRRLMKGGAHAFLESSGIGVGAGGVQAVLEQAQVGGVTAMHNFWVEVLVDGGVIGFSLLCLFCFVSTAGLVRILRTSQISFCRDQARLLILSLVIFSIGCISVSTAIYFLPMWVLLGLTVALIRICRCAA